MPHLALPIYPERRKWLRAAACACASTPLWGYGKPTLTIRFSHVVAQDTPKGLAVSRFQELVHERSAGEIRVEIFSDAQLYGDSDEVQALQFGAVEMLAPSLSKFGRIGFPEYELFDLPFLFDDINDVRRITQGMLGQRLLDRLTRQRLLGLGYLDNGFKHMSANRPLHELGDFRGLRMRVQASRVIAEQMRALGAKPFTLPFGETRQALASGVVDGTENPISNFWTQRMHEVQAHLSLTQHGYLGYAVIVNQRFWMSRTKDERTLINQALNDALAYGNAIADAQNNKALQALQQAGTTQIYTPTKEQRTRFRAAVQPVYESLTKRIGKQWTEALKYTLDKPDSG